MTMVGEGKFNILCGGACKDRGNADCRLSTCVYNSQVMLDKTTGALTTFSKRVAGVVLNQTRVVSSLAK